MRVPTTSSWTVRGPITTSSHRLRGYAMMALVESCGWWCAVYGAAYSACVGVVGLLSLQRALDEGVAELLGNLAVDSGYIEARERVETRGAARQP